MSKGHGERLSRLQETAIAALLTSATLTEAAVAARVHEKTLRKWLKLPHFTVAFREARREVVEVAVSRLQLVAGQAVETLQASLSADRAADRIRAAVALLDHAVKAVEVYDLAQQVAELKQLVTGKGAGDERNTPSGREAPQGGGREQSPTISCWPSRNGTGTTDPGDIGEFDDIIRRAAESNSAAPSLPVDRP
jgi:hypothetical protein